MSKLKFCLIISLFAVLAGCIEQSTSTTYSANIINMSDKILIVEYFTQSDTDTIMLLPYDKNQSGCSTQIFHDYRHEYLPGLTAEEFYDRIYSLNISYLSKADTFRLNTDSNYYKNIDLWEHEVNPNSGVDEHTYLLQIK